MFLELASLLTVVFSVLVGSFTVVNFSYAENFEVYVWIK